MLPPERVLHVRYEKLVSCRKEVERLLAFAEVEDRERVLSASARRIDPSFMNPAAVDPTPDQWREIEERICETRIRLDALV
jgi:hypothetical protein